MTTSNPAVRVTVSRQHEWHMGHCLHDHEGACRNLHGHSYIGTFHVEGPELDSVGRVIDFAVIKHKLVRWIEDNWDHKFLIYGNDPRADALCELDPHGVVITTFNPTAENIASHLLRVIGPSVFEGLGVRLVKVTLMETGKCGATVFLDDKV